MGRGLERGQRSTAVAGVAEETGVIGQIIADGEAHDEKGEGTLQDGGMGSGVGMVLKQDEAVRQAAEEQQGKGHANIGVGCIKVAIGSGFEPGVTQAEKGGGHAEQGSAGEGEGQERQDEGGGQKAERDETEDDDGNHEAARV